MSVILNGLSDKKLSDLLLRRSVGVMPTDTVYGLACRAADEISVRRLYNLKKREHKPGTIIAASAQQLVDLGFKYRYIKAIEHFWPNPLSVVLPCGDQLAYLHLGQFGLAVRVPKPKDLQQLLQKTGPLLTSSANQPGKPPANNIEEAQKYLGDKVDFYVDGGDLSGQNPSTVIRIVDDAIEVIRAGAATIDETGKIT